MNYYNHTESYNILTLYKQTFDYTQDTTTTSPYKSKSAASVILTMANSPCFK